MASSADSMVRDAIKAYHAGSPEEARNLLFKAVEVDEANEQAWLWLSAVVEADADKQTCLENVLTINPNNEKAKQGLRILRDKASAAAAPPPQSSPLLAEDDPFANVSFTQPNTSTSEMAAASPFSADDDDEDEELPTGVAWGSIETSSASATPPRAEPGPDEYEDWISNLNIGGNEAQETFGDEENGDPALNAAPFIGDDDMFGSDSPFELDDSFFGLDDPAFEGTSATLGSPFSSDIVEDEPPAPASPPPPTSPAPQSSPPPLSPVPERDSSRPNPLMESFAVDDELEDFGFLDDSAFDDAGFSALDPEEYFGYIPSEIKATRLPGTNERYPTAMVLSLLLLLVLNVGALVLVFITLTSA